MSVNGANKSEDQSIILFNTLINNALQGSKEALTNIWPVLKDFISIESLCELKPEVMKDAHPIHALIQLSYIDPNFRNILEYLLKHTPGEVTQHELVYKPTDTFDINQLLTLQDKWGKSIRQQINTRNKLHATLHACPPNSPLTPLTKAGLNDAVRFAFNCGYVESYYHVGLYFKSQPELKIFFFEKAPENSLHYATANQMCLDYYFEKASTDSSNSINHLIAALKHALKLPACNRELWIQEIAWFYITGAQRTDSSLPPMIPQSKMTEIDRTLSVKVSVDIFNELKGTKTSNDAESNINATVSQLIAMSLEGNPIPNSSATTSSATSTQPKARSSSFAGDDVITIGDTTRPLLQSYYSPQNAPHENSSPAQPAEVDGFVVIEEQKTLQQGDTKRKKWFGFF